MLSWRYLEVCSHHCMSSDMWPVAPGCSTSGVKEVSISDSREWFDNNVLYTDARETGVGYKDGPTDGCTHDEDCYQVSGNGSTPCSIELGWDPCVFFPQLFQKLASFNKNYIVMFATNFSYPLQCFYLLKYKIWGMQEDQNQGHSWATYASSSVFISVFIYVCICLSLCLFVSVYIRGSFHK